MGGGKKARKTPVFKQRSNAVKTISKAVTSAESMLALAQNLKRVKLAFVLDRDGTVTVSDISFTAVSGPVVIDVTGVDLVEFVRARLRTCRSRRAWGTCSSCQGPCPPTRRGRSWTSTGLTRATSG